MIASQNKMLAHRGEVVDPAGDEKMIKNFKNHLQKIKLLLGKTSHFEVLYINYGTVLKSPITEVEKINQFLGGYLDKEKMIGIIDPKLYRNRHIRL